MKKLLNPDHVETVMALINQGPYFRLLSMVVKELGPGNARVDIDMEKKHLNPFGGIHGGVYSSLIDTAAYWAAYCELDENAGLISLDVQVDNLAAVNNGKLVGRGRCIKCGKTICVTEGVVTDESGKILARGTSKLLVTRGLQTIQQVLANIGGQSLPPKFSQRHALG